MEGVLTRNGQSCLVAYRGNGARDMTSGVELFFIYLFFKLFLLIVITSVRVPPLSLRGYEGWATCGQNSLTGSPQDSLTLFFTQFLFSDQSELWKYTMNVWRYNRDN